jgi:hypothetical protein
MEPNMKQVTVVYHSGYGHTARPAQAVAGPEKASPSGDLATATELGRRVADVTPKLRG